METTIPFAGFYGSIHEQELTYALNNIFQNDSGDPNEALVSRAFDLVAWGYAQESYARAYTKALAAEFELKLEFKLMTSPREYNFQTDRIFCEIDILEVRRIFEAVDKQELKNGIKRRFSSRSGFISFYPNSLEEWPENLEAWDHNQVGTLLAVYIEGCNGGDFDSWNYEASEVAYEAVSNALIGEKAERLYRVHDYLRAREERSYR